MKNEVSILISEETGENNIFSQKIEIKNNGKLIYEKGITDLSNGNIERNIIKPLYDLCFKLSVADESTAREADFEERT